jgi:putative nucleotidyltransferase with HDIG domain
MFEWLKKQSLVRRGLSCGKSRRHVEETDLRTRLDQSLAVRTGLLLLFILGVIRIGCWQSAEPIQSVLVMAGLFIFLMAMVLPVTTTPIWRNNHLLLLLLGTLTFNLLLNKSLLVFSHELTFHNIPLTTLLVPSALAPMLISILISTNAGLLAAFFLALLGDLFIDSSPSLFLSSLTTGFAAAYFTRRIRRRADLLAAGVGVGFVGLACTVTLGMIHSSDPTYLLLQSVWAVALGLLTSFVVSAVLPVLEWTFDRITDISWVELSDLNHPLLRRMTVEASGTYHHSLMVANLAEAAAEGIGANSTMCRVCSYFHDIGKLVKPEYFVENMVPERNPHNDLSPFMSALIIIAHVKEGVDLALKHHLRKPVIDVIQQHHGTSLVFYFYRKAMQQQADARAGGKILKMREDDVPDVEERSFRYPGPTPQTKESAIISLADSVESASRSLKNPTPQKIENLVREIITNRVEDGQLAESNLTFNELEIVADRFVFTLKNMLHARIDYPKEKTEEAPRDSDSQPSKAVPHSRSEAAG